MHSDWPTVSSYTAQHAYSAGQTCNMCFQACVCEGNEEVAPRQGRLHRAFSTSASSISLHPTTSWDTVAGAPQLDAASLWHQKSRYNNILWRASILTAAGVSLTDNSNSRAALLGQRLCAYWQGSVVTAFASFLLHPGEVDESLQDVGIVSLWMQPCSNSMQVVQPAAGSCK